MLLMGRGSRVGWPGRYRGATPMAGSGLSDRDGADGERGTSEALSQGAPDSLRHHRGLVPEFARGEVQNDNPSLAHQVVTAPRAIPVFRGQVPGAGIHFN